MKFKSINSFSIPVIAFVLLFTIVGFFSPTSVLAEERISSIDVKSGSWYEETVQWGISKKIITGYQDGTFRPNRTVTEAEFLAMLLRAFEPSLSISKEGNWANNYYNRAKELNYPVKSYTLLSSRSNVIQRKQVAEFISATEGVNFSGDNAIHYLLAFGLAEGKTNEVSIKSFDGEGKLTRAEALQFIKNLNDYGIGGLLERPQDASNPKDLPVLQ